MLEPNAIALPTFSVIDLVWPGIVARSFYQTQMGHLMRELLLGALLGLVTYAAYDLTNLATLSGFPLVVALVDVTWGTCCARWSALSPGAWESG